MDVAVEVGRCSQWGALLCDCTHPSGWEPSLVIYVCMHAAEDLVRKPVAFVDVT